ncbi:SusC/RagA family TonB-linked outer membrane protein [Segetibacter sp. 3557_3]|uniref:SusC/RagA family TonB-linked outer membrane protein n=1 Tax=Segetibacter sp. 3557_3 TaxID=2547429 RepID=UPI0010583E04|nr:SusC/RagA family TonB-linked outer membrane protein [Segetibacter sp. 3557_3]TDH23462.1 SusC/RagA family TonB-linked outer membrane protein [Segetibacter sp. 3557_3]
MKNLYPDLPLGGACRALKKLLIICLPLLLSIVSPQAQAQNLRVNGRVVDEKGAPMTGATISERGTKSTAVTREDGSFTISLSKSKTVLDVSFVGYSQQQFETDGAAPIVIRMVPASQAIDSVIVVGYGRQRKESVVAAITQTTGKVLQRAGGVSNIGAALTGNVPGVITVQGTGMPGLEDPQIFIRGQGTWNSSGPLILVDGIERSMNGVDIGSVESISVLKDAAATAVFGVKGANGVVLITTKRGVDGKANINVIVNSTLKLPSRLPQKYDAFDALRIRNQAIERELGVNPASWQDYTPQAIIDKYRSPANLQEAERYPNIDWQDESLRKVATAQNANLSISGGSGFVKYFTSVDVLHEGDIMKIPNNNKGYDPGFFYDRLNLRANLDFKLTKSTTLSTNLSGLHGKRQTTYSGFEYAWYQGIYGNAPDLFYPQYSDGSYGYYPNDPIATNNPAHILGNNGVRNEKTTQMTTDFILSQDLGALVKNLSFRASYSLDNTFLAVGGITDGGSTITKWIDPNTGAVRYGNTAGINQFDYVVPQWGVASDAFQNNATRRRTVYQAQLNHSARIGRHNISTMGLFMRNESATGSAFPDFREDWVFRTTYNYGNRYFAEFNGAYNGSQKFGPDYRFDFFPSAAVGWTLTNEPFMKKVPWVSSLKVRGSYGLVGNDNVGNANYLYVTQWSFGGASRLGENNNNANSPYQWFRESVIGNPEIHWETVAKANIGVDYSLFRGLIEGSVELYRDYRTDVLIAGNQRAVPVYFGGTPPPANLGETVVKGYEIEVKFNKNLNRDMRLWGNIAITHAKDQIIDRDDPQLLDDYLKQAGYQIGQTRSLIRTGYNNSWDEVYGSTRVDQNDNHKLPGHFNLIDFNGDGVINNFDNAPYAFPQRPQNTYTASVGFDYKRFAVFVQFYGVNNVTRELTQTNFNAKLNSVYQQGDYWSKDNQDADGPMPRWKSLAYGTGYGDFFQYDGSYLRLKTAEISYTLNPAWVKKAGVQSMRLFVNGNNLTFWSKMPDDREGNVGNTNTSGQGAYPTVRRVNFGFNLSL